MPLSIPRTALALTRWLGPWAGDARPRGVDRATVALPGRPGGRAYVHAPLGRPRGAYVVLPGLHFLGPDAAQTFIETMEETPGVKAAELLPRPAQANRPIFYADAGGETKVLTVSEVHKKFNEMIKVRLDRYSAVRPGQGPGIARPQPKK